MTIDLEELRQKQAFEELMAEKDDTQKAVTTAFLIVQDSNGQWSAYHDYESLSLAVERQATFDDIVGGCENVKLGCQIQQTSMNTMIVMEQRAQAMQQQMIQQQEANKVASLIDPKKLRV